MDGFIALPPNKAAKIFKGKQLEEQQQRLGIVLVYWEIMKWKQQMEQILTANVVLQTMWIPPVTQRDNIG